MSVDHPGENLGILYSDHSCSLGEHTLWHNYSCY